MEEFIEFYMLMHQCLIDPENHNAKYMLFQMALNGKNAKNVGYGTKFSHFVYGIGYIKGCIRTDIEASHIVIDFISLTNTAGNWNMMPKSAVVLDLDIAKCIPF